MTTKSTMGTWKAGVFAALIVVAFFGLLESAFRFLHPADRVYFRFPEANPQRSQSDLYLPDPDLFWKWVPHTQLSSRLDPINENGHRGKALPVDKPDGTVRIVALGDSCTYGVNVGLGETYAFVAEQALANSARGRRVEVLNAGVPGYTSLQTLRAFERDWRRFRPDLVTHYTGWNDNNAAVFLPDRLQTQVRTRGARVRGLLYRSAFYRDLRALLITKREPGPRVSFDDYRENLASLARLCRESGARLLLFTVPSCERDFDYNPVIRDAADRLGLPALDLQRAMPYPRRPLFAADETHPNAAGHAIIGDLLAHEACELIPELDCTRPAGD